MLVRPALTTKYLYSLVDISHNASRLCGLETVEKTRSLPRAQEERSRFGLYENLSETLRICGTSPGELGIQAGVPISTDVSYCYQDTASGQRCNPAVV